MPKVQLMITKLVRTKIVWALTNQFSESDKTPLL